jgi:hypothetical protein
MAVVPVLPIPTQAVVDGKTDAFTPVYRNYFQALDKEVRGALFGPLPAAANDAAAAQNGVPINALYQDTTGIVRVRLS